MKKIIVIAILAMVAGMGKADVTTIWSEDFSSATLVNSGANTDYPTELSELQWGIPSAAVYLDTEHLEIAENTGNHGTVVTISASKFAATGAGTYTLNFDLQRLLNNSDFDVEVWGTTSSAGNSWTADLDQPDGTETLLSVSAGSATVSKLTEASYVTGGATDQGIKAIDFTYDGSSDITLLFTLETGDNTSERVEFDNVSITTAIPEPAVVGMLGLGALVTLLMRRFKRA